MESSILVPTLLFFLVIMYKGVPWEHETIIACTDGHYKTPASDSCQIFTT